MDWRWKQIVKRTSGFQGRLFNSRPHFYPPIDYSEKRTTKERKVHVPFVDYLKVFDTVDRHVLWLCLSRKGLSRKMLNILKSVYENVSCCVRSGHDYTEFCELPSEN